MSSWQRPARLVIAVGGAAFGVALYFSFKSPAPHRLPPSIDRTDPAAVVESAGGRTIRVTRDKEDVRVDFDKLLTYPGGATKLQGVTVTTERESGRVVTIRGNLGQVGEGESDISLDGAVTLVTSDGLTVKTERATYVKQTGTMNAPGPAEFSRGRLSGSGVGLNYNEPQDVLTLLDQAVVHLAAGEGAESLRLTSGTVEFRRPEHVLIFDRAWQAVRATRVMTADRAVAHLDAENDRLQSAELRGNARVTDVPGRAGGVELMAARDIDLLYGPDGQTVERARLDGTSAIHVSGASGQPSRTITAGSMDVGLAGGSTPTSLAARTAIELTIPASTDGPQRVIQAQTLDASGDGEHGLQTARFVGNVLFREHLAPGRDRTARSARLETAVTPGLGTIEDARFQQNVRFVDVDLSADAAAAHYRLGAGTLGLSGSEPGRERPHLVHARVGVHAKDMTIALAGPEVEAAGDVKSVLQPQRQASGDDRVVMPSLLKADQAVNVTAEQLHYSGRGKRAVYTGRAWLWQGDTSIKGDGITVDDTRGDIAAKGSVATTTIFEQTGEAGRPERVRTTTTANAFQYTEEGRRATYTGDAHMNGIQGDVTAARIELFLKPSGDALERAEAYDDVKLREKTRRTAGARMTYFSADERYVMTGAPVTAEDECGRETSGRTLTFYRTTDRIVVDGNELIRTQSKGGGTKCSSAE